VINEVTHVWVVENFWCVLISYVLNVAVEKLMFIGIKLYIST